jgi:thiol-disulfide isomerase/thioredoxin
MSEEVAPTLSPEERAEQVVAAYRAAQAGGKPFDLDAVLAREPSLAAEVCARLASGPANFGPQQTPTLSLAPGTPSPVAAPDATTLSHEGPRDAAPPDHGDFGEYELLGLIARGGMGIVFRARDKNLNRVVALKMILAGRLATADEVRRFHAEAEEASHLDHPNIVPIYRVGAFAGQPYFTMKLIEGGTLGDQGQNCQADLRKAARIMIDVAGAVHYAHQRGILHRDLKPGNILLDEQGRPHVTDFGLAKHLGTPAGNTQSGAIVGTPGYIAPEQAAGRKDLTIACDVYSLGAVLYDLVTGRPPFEAGSALDTLVAVLQSEPAPPHRLNPRIDRDLETICLTCLHKDPARRYRSADAFARDLQRYLAGEPIHARPVGVVERTRKWARRRPAAAAVVAMACLAGVVLAVGGWLMTARLHAALGAARDATAMAEERGQQTEEARQIAETRNDELRRQREAALQRLEGVNDFVVYVNERLANANAPGSIRMEFLNEGLRLNEKFRKGGEDDPAARRLVARLYRGMGDLWQDTADLAQAKDNYGRALKLLEKLAKDFPQEGNYRADLALTLAQQAKVAQAAHEYPQAEDALNRAIGLLEELARQAPAEWKHRQAAAEYRFTLGTFLEERDLAARAQDAYRAALDLQEKLAADFPNQAAVHQQLAATAAALGWLLDLTRAAEAQEFLQRAVAARRQTCLLKPRSQEYRQGLLEAYNDLAFYFKERGMHAALPPLCEQLRRDRPNDGRMTYTAACWLADAVRVVRKHTELPAEGRQRLEDSYAAQSVAMLDKAIKEGYVDRAHMQADTDLDPLRQRQDFRQVVTDLERHTAALTPEKELAALQKLVENSMQQYAERRGGARTRADRKRAESEKPELEAFAHKFLQLAQQHRESSAAIDALVWLLTNCDTQKMGPWAKGVRLQAVQLLQRDHFQKTEFANVCLQFVQTPVPEAEELLKAGLERHERQEVRGLAGLALATSLAQAGQKVRDSNPAKADELLRRADKEFERVAREYGKVNYGHQTLEEIARYQQQEVHHLGIGCVAQEIEGTDLEGKAFKLSDYRGKVVVLDFWADWCGFCRQMYPQEQRMMQELQGKSFALLGVNCDDDREAVREVMRRKGLTWRSWYDGRAEGGRIRRDWHVSSFPNVWVIDHKGVIRFKDLRGPELDAAVNQLLAELEEDRK